MRIAFSGAACTGKTTTLKAFLNKWPSYKTPETSYRGLIKENKHSKETDKKTQQAILDFMVNQQKTYTLHDKIVYDRCPLDNIVYSIWASEKIRKGSMTNLLINLLKRYKRACAHWILSLL